MPELYGTFEPMFGVATSGAVMFCRLVGDAAAIWFLPVAAEGGAVRVNKMPVRFAPRIGGFAVPEFGVIIHTHGCDGDAIRGKPGILI